MQSLTRPSLSIIIPCFNEQDNILCIIDQLDMLASQHLFINEIIVVDGCSFDQTTSILKQKFRTLNDKIFKLVLMDKKNGYGADIISGLNIATGDVLAWTHADLQTDIRDVIKGYHLVQQSKNKKMVVKGRRTERKKLDLILTKGMELVTLLKLKVRLDDINAQPKIMTRYFYNLYIQNQRPPSDFSLDLFLLYQAQKNDYSIGCFPVKFKPRQAGEAKGGGGSLTNRIKLVIRTYKYINKLKNRFIT
jgi:glycosyltransferase involved in cell wall biosynthesis